MVFETLPDKMLSTTRSEDEKLQKFIQAKVAGEEQAEAAPSED